MSFQRFKCLTGEWREKGSPSKDAISKWLAQAAAQVVSGDGPVWSLMLETSRLRTLSALSAALGPRSSASTTVVPNPSHDECAAMREHASGIHVFPTSSHELIATLAQRGSDVGQSTSNLGLTTVADPAGAMKVKPSGGSSLDALHEAGWPGTFDVVWLDYCGTFDSWAGRKRRMDISQLLGGGLLSTRSLLAVTLSARGAPMLYKAEVVDSLAAFVGGLAQEAGLPIHVLGVASTGEDVLSVHTIAFVLGDGIKKACDLKPEEAADLSYSQGWSIGQGFTQSTCSPLWSAVQNVAEAFAVAAGKQGAALVLEGKMLAVTQALKAQGLKDIVTVLTDPLEGQLAASLHKRSPTLVLERGVIVKHFQKNPPTAPFDIAWFEYEGKLSSRVQFPSVFAWPRYEEMLSIGLLSKSALVAVSFACIPGREPWEGAAVDWVLMHFKAMHERHGYTLLGAGAARYTTTNVEQVTIIFRLGGSQSNETTKVLKDLSPSTHPKVAGWEYVSGWDLNRVKIPTAALHKFKRLAPFIADIVQSLGASTVLLHEPGFFHVLPEITRVAARVICCTDGDAVTQADLKRRSLESRSLIKAEGSRNAEAVATSGADALVLLEDVSPTIWKENWANTIKSWLQRRSNLHLMIFLFGDQNAGSDAVAILKEFSAQSMRPLNVSTAKTFFHCGKRFSFVVAVAGSADTVRRSVEWASEDKSFPLPAKPFAESK